MSPISQDTKEWHNSKHTAGNSLLSSHIYTCIHIHRHMNLFLGLFSRSDQGHVKVKDNYAQHANLTFPLGFESCISS